MIGGLLVDAGPLVAIFNRRDRHHEACVRVLGDLNGRLCTTWPAVVEAMDLLEPWPRAQAGLLQMMEREVLQILPIERDDLPPIRKLMAKYGDLPMDFADATLLRVAGREGFSIVFTLDRCDFAIYRLPDGTPLRILPD